MIEDVENADALFQPTQFWTHGTRALLADLDELGIDQFRRWPSALRFFVPTFGNFDFNTDPARYEQVIEDLAALAPDPRARAWLTRHLDGAEAATAAHRVYSASEIDAAPYTDRYSESEYGAPVQQFEFDGRRFGRSSLNYLLGLNFLKRSIPDLRVESVLEIGGGFGSFGEILCSDERNRAFYVDVDIPPAAYAAQRYLCASLGDDRVARYRVTRDIAAIDLAKIRERYSAAILCPWQLPHVTGDIDLFVNFMSFQEMEPEVVNNYCVHVRRLNPRYVLLRNLREGKQVAKTAADIGVNTPILGEHYDAFFPEHRLVCAQTTPFGHETVDGFHSELRLYVKE